MSDPWDSSVPEHLNQEQFGQLSPEEEAYYEGARWGDEHFDRMQTMSVSERNRYLKGLREGLSQGQGPKRGDLDNPLKQDMPKEPKPPAAPKPSTNPKKPPEPWHSARNLRRLSKIAKGKRRK